VDFGRNAGEFLGNPTLKDDVICLGDACYAYFDAYGIELRLNSHESQMRGLLGAGGAPELDRVLQTMPGEQVIKWLAEYAIVTGLLVLAISFVGLILLAFMSALGLVGPGTLGFLIFVGVAVLIAALCVYHEERKH
jgi:hypothetical protein